MPDGRLLMNVVRDGLMSSLRRLANVVAAIGLFIVLACPPAAQAISPVDMGASRPDERVLDDAEVFSRCLLYTSPSPRDGSISRMPSSA